MASTVDKSKGLSVNHPVIRTLNGMIANKTEDYRSLKLEMETAFNNLLKSGSYKVSPTSYETASYKSGNRDAPTRDLKEIARLSVEMLSLNSQIGELVRTKLHCFRDVDFGNGDFWIPTLLTGRLLTDNFDRDSEDWSSILSKNPLAVTVTMVGNDFVAELGGNSTDGLALMDLLEVLCSPMQDEEPPSVPHDEVPEEVEDALFSCGIIDVKGVKRPRIVAGPHAEAFRQSLRIAVRNASGYIGDDEF